MKTESPDDFRKILERLTRKKSSLLSVFRDFCRLAACTLALQSREEEYLEVAQGYTKDELQQVAEALAGLVNEMQKSPFTDLLGRYYLEVGSKADITARGEFYTPKPVCSAMARMIISVDEVKAAGKPITINDPACGSGGIPLAVAECFAPGQVDLLRFTCQDVSALACDMCYINMTLWGIPAKVIWGDSLLMTIERSWCNLHWFRVGEHLRERFREIRGLFENNPQEEPPEQAPTNGEIRIPIPEERNQVLFDF